MSTEQRLQAYAKAKCLSILKKLAKGYSSEVFLVENSAGQKFALKIEKDKSPRKDMVKKEAANLALANSVGIGPKLFDFDEENRCLLLEYVEGKPFGKWIFEKGVAKKKLQKVVDSLLTQTKKLDKIGLDHGQLAGKGANILVCDGSPVIIDFEKASQVRKPHNSTQLESFLFKNKFSAIARTVRQIMGKDVADF